MMDRRITRKNSSILSASVIYIKKENQGVAEARNTGIRAAIDFLAFLDSDDLWEPEKIRLQMERCRMIRRSMVYTQLHYLRKKAGGWINHGNAFATRVLYLKKFLKIILFRFHRFDS